MRESSKWLQKHGAFVNTSIQPYSGIFNVFSTGKSMKTCAISKINSRRQQFEVFKKYYKACKLLFKENIPLGRPWPSIKI